MEEPRGMTEEKIKSLSLKKATADWEALLQSDNPNQADLFKAAGELHSKLAEFLTAIRKALRNPAK